MSGWDDSTKTVKVITDEGPTASRRAYLIVLAGQSVGEMFELKPTVVLGRAQEADLRLEDEGISRRHAVISSEAGKVLIEDLESRNGTFVNEEKIKRVELKDGDKIRIGSTTILKFTHHDDIEESFQRGLYDLALRDGLTKAFNKKYFGERLTSELAYAMRHNTPLSLILIDVDHFKEVNDGRGHLAGDFALQSLAKTIADSVRREDVFARYGGDEFAIISRGIDLHGATVFGERLRALVANLQLEFDGTALPMTISVGVAAVPPSPVSDAAGLVKAADQALYEAKRAGRNRVASTGA